MQRRKAKLYQLESQNVQSNNLPDKRSVTKQAQLKESLKELMAEETTLLRERKNTLTISLSRTWMTNTDIINSIPKQNTFTISSK